MRVPILRTAWLSVAIFGASAVRLAGQPPAESVGIIVSAVEHERSGFPSGSIGLDPRILRDPGSPAVTRQPSRWLADRADDETAILTRQHGLIPIRIEDAKRCPTSAPARCRLAGIDTYLAFGSPQISGDTATIIMVLEANIAPPPETVRMRATMNAVVVRFTLVKEGMGWRVALRRVLAET